MQFKYPGPIYCEWKFNKIIKFRFLEYFKIEFQSYMAVNEEKKIMEAYKNMKLEKIKKTLLLQKRYSIRNAGFSGVLGTY